MNPKTLEALEFNKIVEYLKRYALTDLGGERCGRIKPSRNLEDIKMMLDEISEAESLSESLPDSLFNGIKDLREPLAKAKITGLHLNPKELLEIARLAKSAREIKESFNKIEGDFPRLANYIQMIMPACKVEDSIFASLEQDGKILDNASKKLSSLRRKIADFETLIKKKIDGILSKKELEHAFQERYVTIRNSRFVVPVKPSYKHKVPGIVVDRSSTGQTLFVQPFEIVEIDNEITQLKLEEKEEQIKILKGLTQLVGESAGILRDDLEGIAELDFIYSKFKLSRSWKGKRPRLAEHFQLKLVEGYHPILLDLKRRGKIRSVVPFTIELEEEKVLVITGPNTGGKTAALKTIGLLCLICQSGLFPPLNEESELPVFKGIFADIGDEQSFEQSLSTFSAHMRTIIDIIENAEAGSLILFDEIGAGTDPDEGSSLGVAILEELLKRDVRIIVTTHHRLMKTLAYSRPEFKNAAMEFDEKTLMPTYKIKMGLPGRSNAMEVSRQLGLKETIISRAKEIAGSRAGKLDEMIKDLEWESKSIEKLKKELILLKKTNEEQKKRLDDRESFIKYDSFLEAEGILLQARSILSKAEGLLHKKNVSLDEVKSIKKEIKKELDKVKRIRHKKIQKGLKQIKEIREGDSILIKSLNKRGKVLSIDRKAKRMKVQTGPLIVDLDLTDEKLYSAPIEKVKEKAVAKIKIQEPVGRVDSFVPELNIIGQGTNESIAEILKFIDDAILVNMNRVRIIHGVGSGRLKKSVHDLLKEHPNVASFSLDLDTPGGEGVTIVDLR